MQTEPEQWAVDLATDIDGAASDYEDAFDVEAAAIVLQRAFEERERKLRDENARLRESLRNSMPIAGGNPFGRPSQALKETPDAG